LVDGATCVVQLLWANTHWVQNPIKNKSTILCIQRVAHQNVQTAKNMTYIILIWIFSMSGNWWDALNKSKLLRKMGMVMRHQIKGNLR
jgi:hypothetical protein